MQGTEEKLTWLESEPEGGGVLASCRALPVTVRRQEFIPRAVKIKHTNPAGPLCLISSSKEKGVECEAHRASKNKPKQKSSCMDAPWGEGLSANQLRGPSWEKESNWWGAEGLCQRQEKESKTLFSLYNWRALGVLWVLKSLRGRSC